MPGPRRPRGQAPAGLLAVMMAEWRPSPDLVGAAHRHLVEPGRGQPGLVLAPDRAPAMQPSHLVEVGHGGRVAAAQAGQQGGVGELVAVQGGVQLGSEAGLLGGRGAAAAAAVAAAVGRLPTATVATGHFDRGGGVAGADLLAQGVLVGLLGGHRLAPWRSATAASRLRASWLSE